MIEVHCNWKHLMNAGCTVSFSRVTYDDKYNIHAVYAHVEHPEPKRFTGIQFSATCHCGHEIVGLEDTIPFLGDLKVPFKVVKQ